MTATLNPYESQLPAGRDGFAQLLRAEWTKFRTVRGWVIAAVAAAVIMVLTSLLTANGSHAGVCTGPGPQSCTGIPALPVGPGGEAVEDNFYFVHQSLSGNGSITARVTSMTGLIGDAGGGTRQVAPGGSGSATFQGQPGLVPWSKVGIIVKASTASGSAYAAMVVTGDHGVRMQYDYTHDIAGAAGPASATSPRWLRLTRSGDTVTGYDSTNGAQWTKVGTAHLAGLPATVATGLLATSPPYVRTSQHLFGGTGTGSSTQVTGVFDQVTVQGAGTTGSWTASTVSSAADQPIGGVFHQAGGTFTVNGSGDIAPAVGGSAGSGTPIETTLSGAFFGLIIVVVLGALFITAEYRRGLIRTTLTTSPRRGRILAAKAVVIAAVTFVAGLVAAAVALPAGEHLLRSNGNYIYPVGAFTEARIIIGTAALLAVASVAALSVGTILRRGTGAVATVVVVIVLPYIVAFSSALPLGATQWLLRLTPAAAFSIQQSLVHYSQVENTYSPQDGYFPLTPWGGFAVLCAYTALAFAVAVAVLRHRDA